MTTGGKFILLAAVAAVVLLIVFYGGGPVPAAASIETAKAPATATAPVGGTATMNTTAQAPTSPTAKKPASIATRVAEVSQPMAQSSALVAVIEMGKDVPASAMPTKVNTASVASSIAVPSQPVARNVRLTPPARPTRVTIRSGDTLTSIAARTLGDGNKWQQLLDANPKIDPRSLRVGGTIRIPTITPSRTVARKATPSLPGRRHRVGEGDTLSSIAIDYYGDSQRWGDIFEANRAALGGDPNRLVLDVVLVVP